MMTAVSPPRSAPRPDERAPARLLRAASGHAAALPSMMNFRRFN